MDYITLIESFKKDLYALNTHYQDQIRQLQINDAVDEANLEKVRLNVIEIFTTLFDVSCRKTINHPSASALKTEYLTFFERIPTEWYAKKDKCITHNDTLGLIIEEIKIEEMLHLKAQFMSYFLA